MCDAAPWLILRYCSPKVASIHSQAVLRRSQTRYVRQRKRRALFRRSFGLGLVMLLVGGSVAAREALHVQYVEVNAFKVPLVSVIDWAASYKSRWESASVTLLVDRRPYRQTRAELGAHLSTDELEEALELTDAEDADEAVSIDWRVEVDHAKLLETLFALRRETDRRDERDPGAPAGRVLDLHASLKLLKSTLGTEARIVELPTRGPLRRDAGQGAGLGSFSQLLARHTSEYRAAGRSWSRSHNIEQAAKALDGIVIEPNGELSFNEVVGERSFQRGFMPANEIARGRVVDGIGGGVCQVATALHAAALHAGFEVVEHYVHSKRPRYAARGVDSAVAWGLKDLRIRNPYSNYVRIRGDARAGSLSVGLWSGRKPPKVEIDTEVKKGAVGARHQPLVIERTRTVHWPSGTETQTTLLDYPAEPKD